MSRERVEELRHMAYQERMRTFARCCRAEYADPTANPTERHSAGADRRDRALDAITAVKFCFSIQKDRVMQMRRLENTAGIQFPFGNKHLDVLRQMAETLWKVQAGQAILRAKNSWPIHMGEADRVPIDLLPEVQAVTAVGPHRPESDSRSGGQDYRLTASGGGPWVTMRVEWKLTTEEQKLRKAKVLEEILEKMSPQARAIYEQQMGERIVRERELRQGVQNQLYSLNYKTKPVDVVTFVQDRVLSRRHTARESLPDIARRLAGII